MFQSCESSDTKIDFFAMEGSRFLINETIWFDSALNRLHREGDTAFVPVKPICCRLLLILCQRPRAVLTRQFLHEALWIREGMVVADNSLNQAVCHLRDSFSELDPVGIYVKTLPRIGYAFLATVNHVEPFAFN